MKTTIFLGILIFAAFLFSCSDDNSTNNNSLKTIEMQITGHQNLLFKTSNFKITPPPSNPNYIVGCTMNDGSMIHTLTMTIDSKWLDSSRIDFTRDLNKLIFAYNLGKDTNTYHATEAFLDVDELTNNRLKGTLNFTALRINSTDKFITVVNGKVDLAQ